MVIELKFNKNLKKEKNTSDYFRICLDSETDDWLSGWFIVEVDTLSDSKILTITTDCIGAKGIPNYEFDIIYTIMNDIYKNSTGFSLYEVR